MSADRPVAEVLAELRAAERLAAEAERERYGTVEQLERERYAPPPPLRRAKAEPAGGRSAEAQGGHDPSARKLAVRKQRERGAAIYITAEALRKAGIDPSGPPPFYRIWAAPRGRVVVQLYRER